MRAEYQLPKRTLLSTDRTPGVSRATRSAESRTTSVVTAPVRDTIPALVATAIFAPLAVGSAWRRAWTSWVMALSSRGITTRWVAPPAHDDRWVRARRIAGSWGGSSAKCAALGSCVGAVRGRTTEPEARVTLS